MSNLTFPSPPRPSHRPTPARPRAAPVERSRDHLRRIRGAWWRQAVQDIPGWTSVTASFGFLCVALMANMAPFAAGVPASVVIAVMLPSTLTGTITSTVALLRRWPR